VARPVVARRGARPRPIIVAGASFSGASRIIDVVAAGRAIEAGSAGTSPTREVTGVDVTPPGRLGEYHLLRKIGQGGMGEIFLAKRVRLGGFEKTFAIKRMLDSLSGSQEFVSMFFDEARLAARLCHPNVAQIYDFGVVDDHYFIAMEHIAGEDLNTVIRHVRDHGLQVPVGIALRIAIEVCAGLDYAHTLCEEGRPLGIIHRDVSPANIMISYQGSVKLLDFGIAKATSRVSETRTGSLKGKLSFVAPEQIRGLPADPRADLFSFGIGLYGLLCGRHPYRRDSELATMHAITQEDAPDIRQYRPDLPASVTAIVHRALARDRDQRYASAADMLAALKAALAAVAPGTGTGDLAEWLVEVFGRLRKEQKTAVPTVSPVDGVPVVPAPPARRPTADPEASTRFGPVTGPGDLVPRFGWGRLGAAAGMACLLGAAIVVLAAGAPPRAISAGTPPPARTPTAAVTAMPMGPVLPPLPAALAAAAPAGTPSPAADAKAPSAPRARAASVRARPGTLELATLQSVVQRSHLSFTACFRRHAAELPDSAGQVRLELAVAASGKVATARAILPGRSSPSLTACLEGEALRIRFPRHAEQEVRFALPLGYRRGE
jgi:serine/threonine protein kinase